MSNRNLALLFFIPAVLFLGLLNIYCLYKALPPLPVSYSDLTLTQLVKYVLAIKAWDVLKFMFRRYLINILVLYLAEVIKDI